MTRPEKRLRTEGETPAINANVKLEPQPLSSSLVESYTRSDIWFDDGNVILLAESTLFRVYRGLLSAQSPVLKEYFADQARTPLLIEGCVVLRLPHTAVDVTHFLKATLDRG